MAKLVVLLIAVASTALAFEPGYVDSRLCAQCHADKARAYAETGMARSFRPVRNASDEFNRSTFFHDASREWFRMFRRDGVPYVRRWQITPDGGETNVREERVDYVIGAGDQATSYLHRTSDNKLVELPVSWYRENGGHWGMSPAYDRPDHPGFSREINFACMQCHTAYPAAATNGMPGETVFPAQLPEGIDCQRCHGPGQNHVDAASAGKPLGAIRAAIVNPARLSVERRKEVCLQCHLETTSSRLPAFLFRPGRSIFSYRPGEPLGDFVLALDRAVPTDSVELVSTPYRLARSACRTTRGETLECTNCHDPHRVASREETLRRTNVLCVSCHAPHNSQNDCVSCHMPTVRAADAIHASVTDHWISKPHPAPESKQEISARTGAPYAGPVVPYYPGTFANLADQAFAQVQSDPVEALALLNRQTISPALAADAGRAFLTLMQPAKAIPFLRQSLPELGSAQQAAGQYPAAIESFRQATKLAPAQTDMLVLLGEAYAKAGRRQEAITILREAAAHNPESAAAYNDLGSALLSTPSSLPEAETALREAVRLQPEFSSIRMNLADALIRQNKLDAASEQLEEAVRIGGRAETAEAAWFDALLASNDPAKAQQAWKSSYAFQVANAHANLGTIATSQHRTNDAIREYRLALEGDPESAIVELNLAITLFNAGRKDEARPFLKNAATSDDAGIRAAAQSILNRK